MGCLIPGLLAAQGFNLDWSAMPAGGGTSGNGNYVLTAIVGQPFGDETSGANYGLQTDFAGIVENLETAPPPLLRIARADANSVLILWPASATGWVLQQASSPGTTADWTDLTVRVVVIGTDNTVTLPLVAGNRFYRLRQQ